MRFMQMYALDPTFLSHLELSSSFSVTANDQAKAHHITGKNLCRSHTLLHFLFFLVTFGNKQQQHLSHKHF